MSRPNPFPLARFIGRHEEISALVSLVADHGQSRTIVGEPGMGKTSLLHHLASTALTADPSPQAPRLHPSSLNAHTFDAAFDQATFWTEALDPLEAAGLFAPDTPLGLAYRRCQDPPLRPGNQRDLPFSTRTLQRLLKTLGAGGHRLVLLVDEFDYLVHRHIARHSEFFAGLRALTIDPSRALALVTASRTPLKTLNKLAADHGFGGSPYFNAGAEILLGAYSEPDVNDLLFAAGDAFSPDDRRLVHTLSGGYPHLVQTAAASLFAAADRDPAQRRLAAAHALRREASATLDDIWRQWPSAHRHVFAAVAVEHLDALGTHVAWAPAGIPFADPATYPEEVEALDKHGFIASTHHTPSGYAVRPLVFLAWCAAKLRGHAQSAQEWTRWMDAEGWTGARQRDTWEKVIRPRAVTVRTDLETLLSAHAALSKPPTPPPSATPFVPPAPRGVRLFYSHAPADASHLHRLEDNLVLLKREDLLETWSSADVRAGDDWLRGTRQALENADLIILLVSADFLASDYLWEKELAHVEQRVGAGLARVVTVRLRPADWNANRFWPGRHTVLPADGRALTQWSDPDAAWVDVAAGIRRVVKDIAEVLAAPPERTGR